MEWYRRLIYDAFRGCYRKISPVESFSSRSNSTRSAISHPIFRNSVLDNYYVVVKNKQRKIPNSFAKRFHIKVNHSKAREFGILIRLGLLGCGASCVYYCNLETVPFTNRRYFVLASNSLEKKLGDLFFNELKSRIFKEKIVASHESIRVEKIGRDIVGALLEGLRKTREQTSSAHLEIFDWEFIVVDDPTIANARCLPGGKIVVYTGLLNHLKTDAEIATIIGHEVGHAVARHCMTGKAWLKIIRLFMPDNFVRRLDIFIMLPLSRRDEIEADYIGMLGTASAGYDPRIAPEVWLKLEEYPSGFNDDHSSHPHGEKRAQLLSQPEVMEEALSLYTEALKEKDKNKDKEPQIS